MLKRCTSVSEQPMVSDWWLPLFPFLSESELNESRLKKVDSTGLTPGTAYALCVDMDGDGTKLTYEEVAKVYISLGRVQTLVGSGK